MRELILGGRGFFFLGKDKPFWRGKGGNCVNLCELVHVQIVGQCLGCVGGSSG